jgi:hypothetical protein
MNRVSPSTPPTPYRGIQPLIQSTNWDRWVLERITAIYSGFANLISMCVSNAMQEPKVLQDAQVRLARYPWWPVSGQTADNWVYYDEAAGIWRYLSTAPTSTH